MSKPVGIVLVAFGSLLAFGSCSDDGGNNLVDPGPDLTIPPDSAGWFVDVTTGDDDSVGTKTAPFKTIERGIAVAFAAGGGSVFVAEGIYTSPTATPLDMRAKVDVFGGYDGATWGRNPAGNLTEISGPAIGPAVYAGFADSCTIDGFTIRSPDHAGTSPIGITVFRSLGVVISNNKIIAGNGGNGADGTTGTYTFRNKGANGEDAGACPSLGGAGEAAIGVSGARGGDGQLADGSAGSSAGGSDATYGYGGAGGVLGSPNGKDGAPGRQGVNGPEGARGDSIGILLASSYLTSSGADGGAGTAGRGGGGGGGGYGDLTLTCGGAGGGGGAGAAAGPIGTGGGGGSGSFGIFVGINSTAEILNVTITVGNGGDGGRGGRGDVAAPGTAGQGGSGGLFASKGGNGGEGGGGGRGGYGGPGGGGPSIGIAEHPTASTTRTAVVVTLGTPGLGGKRSDDPGLDDFAPNGIAREYYKGP
jgi:hypothetical protein